MTATTNEPQKPKKGRHPTKPFLKNNAVTGEKDSRINRTGLNRKAKNKAELAREIQAFLNEDGGALRGTRLGQLMLTMFGSDAALDHKTLLEYGYGKLDTPLQAQFNGPVIVTFVDEHGKQISETHNTKEIEGDILPALPAFTDDGDSEYIEEDDNANADR